MKRGKKRSSPIWAVSTEEFRKIVDESETVTEALDCFDLKNKGANYKTFVQRCNEEGIDLSEKKRNAANRRANGLRMANPTTPLDEILIEGSRYDRTSLKPRLIGEGLLEEKCCICGLGYSWNGKPLVLVLDHINGVNDDNRIENLRLICPNCNSQQDTFAGRNNSDSLEDGKIYCRGCGEVIEWNESRCCDGCLEKIDEVGVIQLFYLGRCRKNEKNRLPKPEKCSKCSAPMSANTKSGLCEKCFRALTRIVERPSYEDLLEMVSSMGYCETGRKFGVSDNVIRKWIKSYEVEQETVVEK